MAQEYGTTATTTLSYTGIIVGGEKGEHPKPTPKELIVTRAVENKQGWTGQIIMTGEIILEFSPYEKAEEALGVANEHVKQAFKSLFTGFAGG
jgi:hypothetical protein